MTNPDVLDGAEIERIVAGLSNAQREALLGPVRRPGYGLTIICLGSRATCAALDRRRLVDGAALTERGLAVRAHLARTVRPLVDEARGHGGEVKNG